MISRTVKSAGLALLLTNYFVMQSQQLSQQVDLPELGLIFEIPDGWSGQVDGDYILLGHTTIPGLMILSTNTAKSIPELEQLAAQGIVDEGVKLDVDGEFKAAGNNRLQGFYKGTFDDVAVKCYAIGLINGLGRGMNILILTETYKFTEQHKAEANTLASSVVFTQAEDAQGTTFWKQKIMGKQLYYGLTRGDGSEKRILDLCSDGSFHYYGNSRIAFDENFGFGSADGTNTATGNYTITNIGKATILSLTTTEGKVYVVALSTNEAGNTFLDDSRYYVQNSERCN